MTSGERSPWAQGAPPPPTDPYGASYAGPWGPPPVTDEQLLRLPPPAPAWSFPTGPSAAYGPSGSAGTRVGPAPDQRPTLVGLAVTLAVTASMLWVCGLSLFVVVALAGTDAMSAADDTGVVFHTLDSFVLRMGDGLWVPLYGFPVASVVSGFLLLSRRPWARVAHTVVGVATLGWAGFWLRDSPLAWVAVAVYVGLSVAVLWAPSVGRWYAGRPRPARQQLSG